MVTVANSDKSIMAEVDDSEWERISKHQSGEELATPCVVYAFRARVMVFRGQHLIEDNLRVLFARWRPADDERLQRVG